MTTTSGASRGQRPAGHGVTSVPDRLWVAMLVRALPAAVVALIVTFTQEYTPSFSFVALGAFALASGVLIGFEAIGIPFHPARALTFARSIVSAIAGGAALVFGVVPHLATVTGFIWHVSIWAIVTGLLELLAAWQVRRLPLFAREVLISGALTLLFGIVIALVPPDLDADYGGLEQIEGSLTATVQSTGFLGAYAAVLAVLLIIEGLTLRGIARRAAGGDPPDPDADASETTTRNNGSEEQRRGKV
ncbi:MAG: HdeD family acid-resistance protein [Pseudoclavibacter sp.]